MKKIVLLIIAAALTGVFGAAKAQDSDKELSSGYAQKIKVLESEIKTLKLKLKSDKENVSLKNDLDLKSEALKELKSKKKTVDTAIKSRKASEKASEKAEKALKKAEKANKALQQLKEGDN